MGRRHVQEGIQAQGEDESIIYSITTTPWGSSPTGVVITVKDITDQGNPVDVTSTVAPGSASVDGDAITLPAIANLTAKHRYQVEIRFTTATSSIFEALIEIWAEV